MDFGNYIKEQRLNKGIGSRELCRAVGIAETYVSQMERGKIKKPDYEIAYKLCTYFDLDDTTIIDLLAELHILPPKKNSKDSSFELPKGMSDYLDSLDAEVEFLKFKSKLLFTLIENVIEKDLSRGKILIHNMTSMTLNKHNFDFFCELLSRDIAELDDIKRKQLLDFIDNLKQKD